MRLTSHRTVHTSANPPPVPEHYFGGLEHPLFWNTWRAFWYIPFQNALDVLQERLCSGTYTSTCVYCLRCDPSSTSSRHPGYTVRHSQGFCLLTSHEFLDKGEKFNFIVFRGQQVLKFAAVQCAVPCALCGVLPTAASLFFKGEHDLRTWKVPIGWS